MFQGSNMCIYTARIFPTENGDIPSSYISLPEGGFFFGWNKFK